MNQLKSIQKIQHSKNNSQQKVRQSHTFSKPIVHPYIETQGIIGNHGVLRRSNGDIIQAKFGIGQPNGRYEQEAGRMADKVMGVPAAGEVLVKPEAIQSKSIAGNTLEVAPNIESGINTVKKGGRPLSQSSRSFFEPRFGVDFSRVRLHTDSTAASTAHAINAEAFTTGTDVVFAAGRYSPETSSGKKLIAHELTHVLQQSASGMNSGAKVVSRQETPGKPPAEAVVPVPAEAAPAEAAAAPTKTLSGKGWIKKFPKSSSLDDLSAGFKPKVKSFVKMLSDHSITYHEVTTKRPIERQYLMYYSLKISNGTFKAKNVPDQEGVNINWVHDTPKKSKAAAAEMKSAYGLGSNVGKPKKSNHSEGNAIDMKLDFKSLNKEKKLKYKKDDKDKERVIKTDDEARKGVAAAGKSITDIKGRELSKAGADFGVKRAIDSDIVHWSTTGK
jgi:hypothetical protein